MLYYLSYIHGTKSILIIQQIPLEKLIQGFDLYGIALCTLQSALHSNDEKAEFGYSLDRKSFFIQQTTTITNTLVLRVKSFLIW